MKFEGVKAIDTEVVKDANVEAIEVKVKAGVRQESVEPSNILEDRPTKKSRIDNSTQQPVAKSINSSQVLLSQSNEMKASLTTSGGLGEKTGSGHNKDPLRPDKGIRFAAELEDLENRPSKKAKLDTSSKEKSRNNFQKVFEGRETDGKVFEITRRPEAVGSLYDFLWSSSLNYILNKIFSCFFRNRKEINEGTINE